MPRIETRSITQTRNRKYWNVTPISHVVSRGCNGYDYIHYSGIKRVEPPSYYRNENFGTVDTFYRERSDIRKGNGHTPLPYYCTVHENQPGKYRTVFKTYAYQEGANCKSQFSHSMEYEREEITCDAWYGDRLGAYLPTYWNPSISGNSIATDMESVLTRKLHKKIHKNRAAFGNTLGELGKTAQWLQRRASGLVKSVAFVANTGRLPAQLSPQQIAKAIALSDLPKKTKRKMISRAHAMNRLPLEAIPTQVARLWLEYRYALMPFIKDVDTAMRYLVFRRQEFIFSLSVSDGREFQNAFTRDLVSQNRKISTSGQLAARMKIRARVANPLRYVLTDAGLDITQIPQVAYELLPFSWMVDWSWQVGEFLMQLSSFTGLTFLDGFYSWKLIAYSSDTVSFRPSGGGKFGTFGSANFSSKTVMSRRVPLYGFPYFALSYDNPFGLKRLADLAALLTVFRQARLNPNLRI